MRRQLNEKSGKIVESNKAIDKLRLQATKLIADHQKSMTDSVTEFGTILSQKDSSMKEMLQTQMVQCSSMMKQITKSHEQDLEQIVRRMKSQDERMASLEQQLERYVYGTNVSDGETITGKELYDMVEEYKDEKFRIEQNMTFYPMSNLSDTRMNVSIVSIGVNLTAIGTN